ncbi:MAG: M1 family metallopeptidase [Cyclobacteriaceae bacterium]|jgi:aminopeptidase N
MKFIWWTLLCLAPLVVNAQHFSRADSLRGTLNANRNWWDVQHYGLTVEPDYESKSLRGRLQLVFKTVSPGATLQLDLQQPLLIDSVIWRGRLLRAQRDEQSFLISFPETIGAGQMDTLHVLYHGKPREAVNPPWDGGWIWAQDARGRPWMSVACQGLGASVWYPCKDHQSDEPESGATITVVTPKELMAVANGRLKKQEDVGNKVAHTWEVTSPINTYNLVPYIGHYSGWNESYTGVNGKLDLSYYVLDYETERAKKQFTQVPSMLKCFEYWFGPYPFYRDGFKLVQSPHLGMEHQSAIAYGNKFMNGYLGNDLSGTGWGLKWDFIIIHESGHEWFGNSITTADIADMWVHEGFTAYSETLYTECLFGKEAASDYVTGTRRLIQNDKPIIGPYGVNTEGSGDMYYKGANLIHTLRQLFSSEESFRQFLQDMNKRYFIKTATSSDIEKLFSQHAGRDLTRIFDQYLRTTQLPVLEYQIISGKLSYRWANTIDGFDLPVKLANSNTWLKPTGEWKKWKGAWREAELIIDPNFFVRVSRVN